MTKSQLRKFAKDNNISVAQARFRINKENTKTTDVSGTLNFYSKEDLFSQNGPASVIRTPDGFDTTDEGLTGVLNYQIYGNTGDRPVYKANTNKGACYFFNLVNGGSRKQERMITLGKPESTHIVISFTGKPDSAPKLVDQVLKSLPAEQVNLLFKSVDPRNAKLYVSNATTPLGLL